MKIFAITKNGQSKFDSPKGKTPKSRRKFKNGISIKIAKISYRYKTITRNGEHIVRQNKIKLINNTRRFSLLVHHLPVHDDLKRVKLVQLRVRIEKENLLCGGLETIIKIDSKSPPSFISSRICIRQRLLKFFHLIFVCIPLNLHNFLHLLHIVKLFLRSLLLF